MGGELGVHCQVLIWERPQESHHYKCQRRIGLFFKEFGVFLKETFKGVPILGVPTLVGALNLGVPTLGVMSFSFSLKFSSLIPETDASFFELGIGESNKCFLIVSTCGLIFSSSISFL